FSRDWSSDVCSSDLNDGQKGVGLVMLILIGIIPAKFALDNTKDPELLNSNLVTIESIISKLDTTLLSHKERLEFSEAKYEIQSLRSQIDHPLEGHHLPENERDR